MLNGSLMKLHLKNVNRGQGLKREYTRNVLWEVFRFPFENADFSAIMAVIYFVKNLNHYSSR